MCMSRMVEGFRSFLLRRAVFLLMSGLVLGSLSACTEFQSVCSKKWMEDIVGADADEVDQIAVRWDNRLRIAQDPTNYAGGVPGVIGRVYLVSEQSQKMCEAHGKIVVAMLDMTPTVSGQPPLRVAEWSFDAKTLKKLKATDGLGVGYTVFLPWEKYRPEIRQVKLLVQYVPHRGEAIFADQSLLTLQSADQPAPVLRETVGTTPPAQFEVKAYAPTKQTQGPPQPMPYQPVQMERNLPPPGPALPQTNANRPSVPQQADPPFQPIVMPSQRQGVQVVPQADENPSTKTTVQYLPVPAR